MVKTRYKQTEVGLIPEEWNIKPLKEVAPLQRGFDLPYSSIKEGRYPVVFSNGIGAFHSSYMVKGPGVVTGRSGTIGKIHYVEDDYWPHNTALWVTDFHDNDPLFIFYLFRTIPWNLYNSGSGVPTLNRNDVHDYLVSVPTKKEQINIAILLADSDNLIDSLEKQLAKKKAIKQGAMQELLTGKRRLPGFSGEWINAKIGSMTEVYSGGTPNTSEQTFWGGNIPWMNSGELNLKIVRQVQGRITKAGMECSSTHFIPAECVLIGLAGQGKTRGTAAFNTFALCTNQSIAAIYPNPNKFDSKFLYYKMDTQYDRLRELSSGDGSRGGLNKKLILNYEVVIPQSVDEQTAIATILTEMDDEIENLEMKLTKYRQVKQGMMQQLLTGKIRLKNDVVDSAQEEQVAPVNMLPAKPAHNHQFDDAVSIAAIVDAFYSERYPLGRVKVQKLLYLLHRHQAVSVSDFKKKAAGPYADTVRYKGGEPIAMKNRYIASESGKQGTRYSKGDNIAQALDYVEQWGMQADMQWLKENFLYTSRDDLELFATVDMAMCDLNEADIPVSVEAIKNLIASDKEWKAKLSKAYFSDRDIARAIRKCTELFS